MQTAVHVTYFTYSLFQSKPMDKPHLRAVRKITVIDMTQDEWYLPRRFPKHKLINLSQDSVASVQLLGPDFI